jgi:hypothetical protein
MCLWDEVLAQLKPRLAPISYEVWFTSAFSLYEDDHRIIVLVPTTLYAKRFRDTYGEILKQTFKALGRPKLKLYCIHHEDERISLLRAAN